MSDFGTMVFRKIPGIGLPSTCEVLSHGKHTALIPMDWNEACFVLEHKRKAAVTKILSFSDCQFKCYY